MWKQEWEKTGKTARLAFIVIAILGAVALLSECGEPSETGAKAEDTPTPQASAPPPSAAQISPETVITFRNGTYACLTKDHLQELLNHGAMGEATKANAMIVENGGDCFFIQPTKKVRVISAEYNTPDIGVLEIVGSKNQSASGVWALSIGAEPVK